MPLLNNKCRKFSSDYERNLPLWRSAADEATHVVQNAVRDTGIGCHLMTGRAKDPNSLRVKLRKKGYKNPKRSATDLLGVRVITYYPDNVDTVAAYLKTQFDIDEANSVDKRGALGLSQFGYRSVHLIARRKHRGAGSGAGALTNPWFEIQVRSLLEHAWAEIEHEVLYKGGVEYPDEARRRFAAIAGVLELLDAEFKSLREERRQIVEMYCQNYREGLGLHKRLTPARLMGFLMAECPDGLSWLAAESANRAFPRGIEAGCVEALNVIGVCTARALRKAMREKQFLRLRRRFAANSGVAPPEVSHLALVVLLVVAKRPHILRPDFAELIDDPELITFVN